MRMRLRIVLVMLFFYGIACFADSEKSFGEFNALISLPDASWRWAGDSLPGTLCAARDSSGNIMSFFAAEDKSFQVNKSFIDTFEEGFFSEPGLVKRHSGIITFNGLPCYELVYELGVKKTIVIRIFSANGIFYRIDAISNIDSGFNPDRIFSCFRFQKTPETSGLVENEQGKESGSSFLIILIIGISLTGYMLWVVFSRKRDNPC